MCRWGRQLTVLAARAARRRKLGSSSGSLPLSAAAAVAGAHNVGALHMHLVFGSRYFCYGRHGQHRISNW